MTDSKVTRGAKKERVLHTRVPAVLEQELKRVATAWRVPVSNVVRSLLEEALDTVEVVGRKAEGELRGVADKLKTERSRLRKASEEQLDKIAAGGAKDDTEFELLPSETNPLAGAVGVTPITLVGDAVCGVTGRDLSAGTKAYLVHFDGPGRQMITGRDVYPDLHVTDEPRAH